MKKQKAVIRLSSASGNDGCDDLEPREVYQESLTPRLQRKVRCGRGPSDARLTLHSSGRPNVVLFARSVVFLAHLGSCRPPLSAIVIHTSL